MGVYQITYYSNNTIAKSNQSPLSALREIVSFSQLNNRRDCVTGYLIFDRACFLQILEGERSQVLKTFRRIEADPRHSDVVVMGSREAPERLFPNWTMAGALRSLDQDEIFIRHGIGRTIVPSKLKSDTVIALALDLSKFHAEGRANIES